MLNYFLHHAVITLTSLTSTTAAGNDTHKHFIITAKKEGTIIFKEISIL